MPIVLFTLIEDNQRLNPFTQAGIIHNNGLDYIIANIGTADVAQLATNYIVANYTTNVIYPEQTIDPLSAKGFNVTINPTGTLIDIDLDSCYNEYVQKVFSYIDSFPPTEGANTVETSYVIFNADYAGQFNLDMNNLLNEILDSGLPQNQMALALIALSILNYSYSYWQNVYNNIGTGGAAWYTFITGFVSSIKDINWREIIQQDIKGALQGAVAANRNNLNNIDGSRIIGAAAAGMAASAQNVILQTGVYGAIDPPPPPPPDLFTNLYTFIGTNGAHPYAGLLDVSGVLYGAGYDGGAHGYGVIFKINTDGSGYTDLHDFDNTNGNAPYSTLINVGGVLYGTTSAGGANGIGTIFSINPDGTGFTKLHDFSSANGSNAAPGLLNVSGVLYGTTVGGGAHSYGIIYKINTDGSGFTNLHDFDHTTGAYPYASVINVGGVLYGATTAGGAYSAGIIFSMNPDGSGFTDLHDFDGTNGSYAFASLIDIAGVLYGAAGNGGAIGYGIIYKINPDGTGFTKLHDFDYTNGASPYSTVINVSGVLYGSTVFGGVHGYGTLYRINPDGSGFAKLHDFDGTNGYAPVVTPINIANVLYGTAVYGGPYGFNGVIYSYGPV